MARIASGDRVLIHSAAGGVGLSAVHLCLRRGCTVYATASTEKKRDFLLSLGVTAVFNSRQVASFEQGVLDATGGMGVDVVLNSLSGDAIPASLRLLTPFGRFIELGKRDQYEDTKMGLNHFLNGLTYAAAHFDVLMLRHPDRCRKLLEEVWAELPSLPRLPTTSFGMAELPAALEYFSRGVHIGKVLVTVEDTPVLPALPRSISAPLGDTVAQALRNEIGVTEGVDGIVCLPNLQALKHLDVMRGAQAIVSASPAVIALARAVAPASLSLHLPRWEPFVRFDQYLQLRGHVVAVEEEENNEGTDLRAWILEVADEMAEPMEMEQTFEDAGFDSLMLISFARRLSAKVGKSVSVADIFDHPTPEQLLNSLGVGAPRPQLLLPKAVCLHGFRSNKDAMAAQMAPFISSVGCVEWIFVNAPRGATGPSAPKVPSNEAFEWWGQRDGSFETGWMAPHYDGLTEALPLVNALSPIGVVGFSQGAAIAGLIRSAWVVLFSAVEPPGMQPRSEPSFHSFDPAEDFASQCKDVSSYFSNKVVHSHNHGHTIPRDEGLVRSFASFVVSQHGSQAAHT